MKYSEFLRIARKKGWWLLRQGKGSHEVWTDGKQELSIPNHGAREMPKGIERTFRKKMGL